MRYLYKIVNTVNSKVYIGMTNNPKRRWMEHTRPYSNCVKLKHAMQKHGVDKFNMEILCVGGREYIADLEIRCIVSYDSVDNGYNLVDGDLGSGAFAQTEETRKKISEGLNRYHSENVAWNHRVKLGRRKGYDPHYVAGFWFPHLEVAAEALGVTTTHLRSRKRKGTLGDVELSPRKDSLEKPIYVGGFWFDTITTASSKLRLKRKTIWSRVKRGTVEQELRITQQGKKADGTYSMTGRTGSKHHGSKAVIVHGVEYGSLAEAGRESGYTRKVISNRIKNNAHGFEWA